MKENKARRGHTPNYETFPLAEQYEVIEDSNVSIPSEEATVEAKEWVDFKQM
ncbi:MAG: CDIF630_02480 family spore surface protein [Anaerovoracaceae bacterium]|jgi:hypothetical protein